MGAHLSDGLRGSAYVFGAPGIAPTAEAGLGQTVHVGTTVTLDGTGSSDPDGNVPLTYAWAITERPAGSVATLVGAATPMPSFTPDVMGDYDIQLVVTDTAGLSSIPDTVRISTLNTAPTADAGYDRMIIELGTEVELDGEGKLRR